MILVVVKSKILKMQAANTDNMGKLFVTVFAFAPAFVTNS